jgi:hypothetical protein
MKGKFTLIGTSLLADGLAKTAKTAKTDSVRRTLIRHDPDKLAKVLIKYLTQ